MSNLAMRVGALLLLTTSAVLPAQRGAQPQRDSSWTFAVSPYFWAASLTGDVAQFGLPTVHVDPRFRDILKNLDFAAMAIVEARRNRVSAFVDVMYTKISIGHGTPRGVVADRVGVTSKTFAGLAGASYSVLDNERGYIDAALGGRVWRVDSKLSFTGGALDGRSADDGKTWLDVLFGVRGRYVIDGNLYMVGWALVGPGGAKIEWDLADALGYSFSRRFSVALGYRALGVDYNSNGFVFHTVQHGPILGLIGHF